MAIMSTHPLSRQFGSLIKLVWLEVRTYSTLKTSHQERLTVHKPSSTLNISFSELLRTGVLVHKGVVAVADGTNKCCLASPCP